jgi:hypothetical protein
LKDGPGIQGLARIQAERSQGSSIGPGGKEEARKKEEASVKIGRGTTNGQRSINGQWFRIWANDEGMFSGFRGCISVKGWAGDEIPDYR